MVRGKGLIRFGKWSLGRRVDRGGGKSETKGEGERR